MSIGQLVMALCLSRATEIEAKIVAKMEAMAANSADLEKLTALDKDLVEWLAAIRTVWSDLRTFETRLYVSSRVAVSDWMSMSVVWETELSESIFASTSETSV